ncbi:MAG: ATP-binding protein, partial [Akkermansia sp.]
MENHPFQTEVRQLLDIVIHAFYSDREIFVRELVSNASDALEKLRLKQLTESSVYQPERELRISIETDEEGKTLTIADSGIGMTREEVVEYLGTIAHSGTKKFLEAAKESGDAKDLIGQFGVGFYSVFMAADKVEVTTRSWQPEAAPVRWVSDGQEGYELEDAPDDTPRGTRILIRLKEDAADFAKPDRLRYVLGKYSNFVGFPIDFNGEHLNTVQAIWMKNKKEVSEEEYTGFYQF